ncbi:MEDS domain-containing protein [Sutcliffiella sp. NPDC057660]|uniref:MEDS domain-containing protein n=1 Tax=Sutcliffiella sp. NPDC057660 TaxID=3346199 RepID=UPI00367C9772
MALYTTTALQNLLEGHVYYRFQDEEVYLDHLMGFIRSGMENKQQILVIDSMKNIPKIKARLEKLCTPEEVSMVHIVNNFNYYLLNGDFHTKTILTHFQMDLSIMKNAKQPIRTWAQVEWCSNNPDAELVRKFESIADDYVLKEHLLSVCAYSLKALTPELDTTLEKVHNYVMTDDEFVVSPSYRNSDIDKNNM